MAALVSDVEANAFYVPVSVRSYGMGLTGTADDSDPGNAYYNPAVLATLSGGHFTAAYGKMSPIFDDIWFASAGLSAGFQDIFDNPKPVGFGLEVRFSRVDWGSGIATSATGEELGRFDSGENTIGLTAAGNVQVSEIITLAVGGAVQSWSAEYGPSDFNQSTDPVDGSGLAYDAGLRAAADIPMQSGYKFVTAVGIGFFNLSSDMEVSSREQSYELEKSMHYGVSARLETPPEESVTEFLGAEVPLAAITANIDYVDTEYEHRPNQLRLGLESAIAQIVFLRMGLIHFEESSNVLSGDNVTLGAGLGITEDNINVRIDFARSTFEYFSSSVNRFGISASIDF
jgi:hypothetical protein